MDKESTCRRRSLASLASSFILALSAAVLVGGAFAGPAAAASCRPPAGLAARALEGMGDWGELAFEARYQVDEAAFEESGRLVATVTLRLEAEAVPALRGVEAAELCAAILVDAGGELPVVFERSLEVTGLAGAAAWELGARLELPETSEQILALLELPGAGVWGAAVAEGLEGPPPAVGPEAVRLEGPPEAWWRLEERAAAQGRAAQRVAVRIVPPRRQPASGGTRIETLVSSEEVERVVFFLDGQQVAESKKSFLALRPFSARIELASPPRVQELRVVAYDRAGFELGDDVVELNRLDAPFRVRISELTGDPASGSVEVAAEVSVPAGARLDRLELYRGEEMIQRWSEPPYRARVPIPEDYRYGDFVRVAAFLADGTSIDDVALLGAEVERVEVNLVEVHAVVTDAEGRPVEGLGRDDFRIVHRGEARPVERFAHADDVSLLLGIVIDTSGSMRLVMDATKRAAAKFIGDTVLPGDRGFVVDFDERPRLLRDTTPELTELFLSLGRLEPEGTTALYDAVVFSMLQFEREGGRKALVVLSDGDDRDSRFGPKDCIEYGRKLGVPIYVIGLGGLDDLARSYPKGELRRMTSQTGGGLYFVETFDELDGAYARINAELRSQYTLGFYTDADLSEEEKRELEVRLRPEGLAARIVVGSGPAEE